MLLARALAGQDVCQSLNRTVDGWTVDLAPLPGFVEICSRDAALCSALTSGFPRGVATVGYFVATDEWDAHRRDPSTTFGHYLIAQVTTTAVSDFPNLKSYVRAHQSDIPDHTELPLVLQSKGRVNLGVFDEADSSISFGVVMRLRRGSEPAPIDLVAINSAVAVKGRLLSLYVYRVMRDTTDGSAAKAQATRWLACLRRANGQGVGPQRQEGP